MTRLLCNDNRLYSLPEIHEGVVFDISRNPIAYILKDEDGGYADIRKRIAAWNSFRRLYHSLCLKTKFRDYLWKNVRLRKIAEKYHPDNLAKLLAGTTDDEMFDDEILENW